MSTRNIEKFNEIAAVTLAHLYETFPLRTTLDMKRYGIILPLNGFINNEIRRNCHFVGETLRWLKHHEYIYSSAKNPLVNLILTEKSLYILNAIPESLEQKKTLGTELTESLKTGAKEAGANVFRQILEKGTGLLVASVQASM